MLQADEPFPVENFKDLFCKKCHAPLGARIILPAHTLTVQRHGQVVVTLGPWNSGMVTCECCGHNYQWVGCHTLGLLLWLLRLAARH